MAAAEYRQPSVAEAVWLVLHSFTRDYRQACLKYWREKFGESFALEVEKEVHKQWAKRSKSVRA